jgi:hypothetical protein
MIAAATMETYMDSQYHRLRELEIELTILERIRTLEERENIEYSKIHSVIYWQPSDKWLQKRSDFIQRYDVSNYMIISLEKQTPSYTTHYENNEKSWELYKDTISENSTEEEKLAMKEFTFLQSLYIFEIQWEINGMFRGTPYGEYETYCRMEQEIASMDLTDYDLSVAWFQRRERVAQYIVAYNPDIDSSEDTDDDLDDDDSGYTDFESDSNSDFNHESDSDSDSDFGYSM